ncbi:Hypothetical predicted protein, partial [Pelobates cultripes]
TTLGILSVHLFSLLTEKSSLERRLVPSWRATLANISMIWSADLLPPAPAGASVAYRRALPRDAGDTLFHLLGEPLFDQITSCSTLLRNMDTTPSMEQIKAECPMPIEPNKVCNTPVVEPKMTQFLINLGLNPCKGLDSALKSYQDKHLDIFGPYAKLFDLAEDARAE